MRKRYLWLRVPILVLAGWLGMLPAASGADDYPDRPIKLYVGFAAGGATDLLARIVAEKLSDRMGQQVIVENRAGAGGVVATGIVAKSAPDGYSLIMVSASHAINVSLQKSLPYDAISDFAPVALVGAITNVLVVNPSLPVKSVAEYIALAKAKPGTINFSSAGVGSSSHLAGELFKSMAAIDIRHVPYKGTADAVRDLISGQVQSSVDSVSAFLPYIRNGQLRVLGVADLKRSALLPDVPTISEAGLPGYEVNAWVGVLAPARTPQSIVERLNHEINTVLGLPDVRKQFQQLGAHTIVATPVEFAGLIKSDIAKFAMIVKTAGVKPQ
ncbi:MAG: tripartite tricarboxylate transporter substrate binding protein [Casimicrobiaceae bacterium]